MTDAAPLPSGSRAGDNIARGIGLTLGAILIFGVQDAVAKLLVQSYSPFQIVMMRYWAFAAFSLFLALRQAPLRQALRSTAPVLQSFRGLLLIVDIWFFALAIRTVPLAELQGITLVYPLLVTLFAIPVLGERVGVFRFAAVMVGFAGALVIVRPGGLPLDIGVAYAMISAACYALYITLTRRVSRGDSATTSLVYVGLVGLVLSTAVGVFHWQPMTPVAILQVAVIMVTTCVAHAMMTLALSLAPASVLQPFNYFSLPWAITLSAIVFGHLIDAVSLLGAAIVVAAGLVVMAREARKRQVSAAEATRAKE